MVMTRERENRRVKVDHMVAVIRRGYEELGHPPTRREVVVAMGMRDRSGREMWRAVAEDCPICHAEGERGHGYPSWATKAMVLAHFPEEVRGG